MVADVTVLGERGGRDLFLRLRGSRLDIGETTGSRRTFVRMAAEGEAQFLLLAHGTRLVAEVGPEAVSA